MHSYGLDTLDARVSIRRIWVLANRLPPSGRVPGEPWSAEANLLAVLVDHVAELTWITARAAGAQNAARPRPIPRPPRSPERAAATRTEPRSAGYAEPAEDGPQPMPSWAAAVHAMAGMPGVDVRRELWHMTIRR